MSRNRYIPRRGDIIRINFDPQRGREQAGRRPALVLSGVDYNRLAGLVVVCPITNQAKGYPFEVAIPPNDRISGVVLADQLKSLDWKERRTEFVCTPEAGILEDVVQKALALIDPEEAEGE